MGTVLNACKSSLSNQVRNRTPQTINETHLAEDDAAYKHQREFEDEFLKNTEDLIQEITTNSQWQHHETRYLLSQFRKLTADKEATRLSSSEFTKLVPTLVASLLALRAASWPLLESHRLYTKWLRHFVSLFSAPNDSQHVTFQSFANTLSTACRGDAHEQAQLLFDIFDIDGTGSLNQSQLALFLRFVLDIAPSDLSDAAHSEGDRLESMTTATATTKTIGSALNDPNDSVATTTWTADPNLPVADRAAVALSTETETAAAPFDLEQIVDRGAFIEYLRRLISPNKGDAAKKGPDIALNVDDEEEPGDVANGAAAEYNQLPLHDDSDSAPIDFLATSIKTLMAADTAALSDSVHKLLTVKLFRKHKLSKADFVGFAAESLRCSRLLASFMIIPTRHDEKRIIGELMQSTEMALGSSWFVMSKEWWDKWCRYTGYNADDEPLSDDDTATNGAMAASATTQRALRPIKISNRELLDDGSCFTVLSQELQENNQFILLPQGAWAQLAEWYGGGPAIERHVVCTDQAARLRVLKLRLKRVYAQYVEEQRAHQEARKKKGSRKQEDENVDGQSPSKSGREQFDAAAFEKEYRALLNEMSATVHPETLRIDLHPVFVNFVRVNDKGHPVEDAMSEMEVSRYATLPELYMLLCASCGYLIEDMDIERANYANYLEAKMKEISAERQGTSKKGKNGKSDKKPKLKALPPRVWSCVWTVMRGQRGHHQVDRLLYPIPNLPTKDASTETKSKPSNDSKERANVKDDDGDTEGNSTTDGDTTSTETMRTKEEDMDLQALGLSSGAVIAVEFARTFKKANGPQYVLKAAEEEAACQPEIDDSWLEFRVGDFVDGRDRWGKWYEAQIKIHKVEGAPMPDKAPNLKKDQKENIEELSKWEAIYIHYTQWPDKWDEWVFIDPDPTAGTICKCRTRCQSEKKQHRLAPHKTQSKLKEKAPSGGSSRYSPGVRGPGRNRQESVLGPPTTAGCVGLVNLGNTCFMNSILQCVSNTPHFRTFFTSGQYKQDINKSNPLGMRGELAHEFAKLVSDVWSGKYKVIAPRSLKRALSKFAPQFSGWQQHDSQEFLAFLLDGLHEDLNLVKSKPYTDKVESNGRPDSVVAALSWKIYLERNRSKMVDLFQAQQKSHVVCPDCERNSITFDTYMYLSVPIVGHAQKSFVVDVFHRKRDGPKGVNKPIRHVFEVSKYQKVRELAKRVAAHYGTKSQFVLFYENWHMKVAREYEHSLLLGMVPDRDPFACYILKDWNEEVSPEEIKRRKLSLQLAKVCHSQPLRNGKASGRGSGSEPLFGMPFVLSFLNVHSRRELHQVLYRRLKQWLGEHMKSAEPPVDPRRRQKAKSKSPKSGSDGGGGDDDDDDGQNAGNENDAKNDGDGDEEEEEVVVTAEELDAYEAAWDEILEALPYRLRLMPHRHYSFRSTSRATAAVVPVDDVVFEDTVKTKEISLIVEWTQNGYDSIRNVVNKVVMDSEYSKWKKEKAQREQNGKGRSALSLYDCISAYTAKETLGENDLWYCSQCKKHQKAHKKLDMWSFPEILVIHLKRFQVLSHGRFGRGEKISTFVDCPIRGLDLSPYIVNAEDDTPPIYDLYAVSCHSGSCGGGHYTAYALNAESDRWYYFNDSSVRPAKESDIISQSSYVLFYKKCH